MKVLYETEYKKVICANVNCPSFATNEKCKYCGHKQVIFKDKWYERKELPCPRTLEDNFNEIIELNDNNSIFFNYPFVNSFMGYERTKKVKL